MGYGVPEAGILAVANATVNAPFEPMVADCVALPMVMEMDSPLGGNAAPRLIAPESVMEDVPTLMDCDGVNPLKTRMDC